MARGRIVDIIVRVNSSQAERSLRDVGATAKTTAAESEKAFNRSQSAIFRTGQAMSSVGRIMTGVGVGLAAVGYYSAKSAISFQTAMTRIRTQAGASQAQVDSLSGAVLKLGQSGTVQYGPTQLAQSLYHIESVAAGSYLSLRKTSNAMAVLKIAAQGAALGGSDLEQTTTALMGALFATREPISQAGNLMGMLNATVGAGNMTMTDLVGALGRGIIPAFRQYGLTASDASAALALFSDSGVKASSAAAQVFTALHYLVQPSTKADKYLRYIHMTSIQMAQELYKPHGFLVALRDLHDHLETLPGGASGWEAGQVLAAIFPGGRGRIMLTVLQNLDRYKGKLDAIFKTQGDFNKLGDAQSHTMAGQLHKAWAVIQSDVTLFGQTLIPIIAKDLPFFIKGITDIFKWFTNLPGPVKRFLGILTPALLIGGPLMIGLGAVVTMLGRFRGALVAIRGVGFGGLLSALATMATRLVAILAVVKALQAAPKLTRAVQHGQVGKSILPGATVGAGAMAAGWALAPETFGLSLPAAVLLGAFGGGVAGAAASGLQKFFHIFGARGGLVTSRGIRHLAGGGPVGTDTIPAWLSAGEGVVNRVGMAGLGTGGLSMINAGQGFGGMTIQPTPVYVMLDGRLIAQSVLRQTLRRAARGPSSLVGGALQVGQAQTAT